MLVLVIRCANGVVVWRRHPATAAHANWICTRDQFSIAAPSLDNVEQTLISIAQHSTQLSGAIQQVVELDI